MSLNYFDQTFFSKYLKENDEVLDICHKHIAEIIDTIVFWMFFGVIVPSFFYYNNSFSLQTFVAFFYFELYLIFIYANVIYKIFDWYNDVWIITNKGVIDLDWQLFKTNIMYIDYNDMRGVEFRQDSIWDGLLNKGDIFIHLEGENANFGLEQAASPGEIVGYLQQAIDDVQKNKEVEEQTSFDILMGALKKVVKDRLIEDGTDFYKEASHEENSNNIDEVLKKKGTIDLRKKFKD